MPQNRHIINNTPLVVLPLRGHVLLDKRSCSVAKYLADCCSASSLHLKLHAFSPFDQYSLWNKKKFNRKEAQQLIRQQRTYPSTRAMNCATLSQPTLAFPLTW